LPHHTTIKISCFKLVCIYAVVDLANYYLSYAVRSAVYWYVNIPF